MKLVELKCKNCGSLLNVEEGAKEVTCEYCHTTFALDDEVQHIKHDDMYESGYEFEKGRIKAQKEHEENDEDYEEEYRKAKNRMSIISFIFSIIFICAFALIIFVGYNIYLSTTQNINSSWNNSNEDFYRAQNQVESQIQAQNERIVNQKTEFEKDSFNTDFERYSGTQQLFFIKSLLDNVITNNKTNNEKKVTVIHNQSVTDEPDKIIEIKHSLKGGDFKEYEIVLDYDEDGYVNKITIVDL